MSSGEEGNPSSVNSYKRGGRHKRNYSARRGESEESSRLFEWYWFGYKSKLELSRECSDGLFNLGFGFTSFG